MVDPRETLPQTRRVYLMFERAADRRVGLRLSLTPPDVTKADAAVILRGMIMDGSVLDLEMLTGSPNELLGEITLAQTATVAISAGVRTLTITGITGLKAGDNVMLVPKAALPAEYMIGTVTASAAGTLKVPLLAPLLAIGQSYSIACKVIRVNL